MEQHKGKSEWPLPYDSYHGSASLLKAWRDARPEWLKKLPIRVAQVLTLLGTADKAKLKKMIESGELDYKRTENCRSPLRNYGKKTHLILAKAVDAKIPEENGKERCPC